MGGIRDRRDQAWIYHRGADPEQHAADQPRRERRRHCGQQQARRLHPHAADDQAFAAPAIAQGARCNLQDAPDGRIDGLQDADAFDAQSERGEEQGKDAPTHAVIEIVDEPGL